MRAATTFGRIAERERSFGRFVPYSSHVSSNTILTKDGDYLRIWQVGGISPYSAEPEELQQRLEQMNMMMRGLASSNVALWTHLIRYRVQEHLDSSFPSEFCRELDRRYFASLAHKPMMASELYLTLLYRPHPKKVERAALRAGRTLSDIRAEQTQALERLDELASTLCSSMERYDLEELRTYELGPKRIHCSKALEFLNYLLTGVWQPVRLPRGPLHAYLGAGWLFAGVEVLEVRTPSRTRFAQCLSIKDYPEGTEPGLLDSLMYGQQEFVFTQSFSFLAKADGLSFLRRQHKQLLNAADAAHSQVAELAGPGGAIDQYASGQFAMGEYHSSLFVFGDSLETVRQPTTDAVAALQELGFLVVLETTATEAAFVAQLPGNWFYRPRIACLTSRNFAGLSSFHNFSRGKRAGNPWGEAVTLFRTPSGQPFYFNFHASKAGHNAIGDKKLGTTLIVGQSGGGKTALMAFLLCQAQKWAGEGLRTVVFDRDRGAELAVRALGGEYLRFRSGEPTGLNPFRGLAPTPENQVFLERWVARLVAPGERLSPEDEGRVSRAVKTVMSMPAEYRSLSLLAQNMTEGTTREEREGSVLRRLAKWHGTGALAWAFDNAEDRLDFGARTLGLDGTDLLEIEDLRAPASMYLMYRMLGALDGRPFIYAVDEFVRWLADPEFSKELASNQPLTIRKKNGLGIFAAQMPKPILESPAAAAVVNGAATEIYLPNPKADRAEYVEGLKLTETEFELVKSLGEDSRQFLVKQGREVAVASFDLAELEEELAVLSGTTENVRLLDQIRAEVGDEPKAWLPVFHARRKRRAVKEA